MKKALDGFAMILTLFAVMGLATPVFACGSSKDKQSTTASTMDKENSDKDSSKKAESDDSDSEEKKKSSTPTKS